MTQKKKRSAKNFENSGPRYEGGGTERVPLYWLRIVWIVMQLIAIYCLCGESQPFFYQAF